MTQITEIPVFNVFDNFEKYKHEPIEDLNLYVVKTRSLNMFFNKRYNLCYGKFIKHFILHFIFTPLTQEEFI